MRGDNANSPFLTSLIAMSLPLVYTPLTKLTAPWFGRQDGRCGQFELDYMRCASTVGMVRAPYDCVKELADFHECVYHQKQFKRTQIMEKERKRQGKDYIEPLGKDLPTF